MPIAQSDIKYYKSSNADSDGGTISATEVTDASLENLFDNVTSEEAEAGLTDYRKLFVKNTHASLSWLNIVAWLRSLTSSADDELALGLGTSLDLHGSSELTQLTASSQIRVRSNDADTRVVTIVGENSSGVRISETITLNGTTFVNSVNTYARLYTVSVATTSGSLIVTIQTLGGTALGTIGTGKYSAIAFLTAAVKATGFKIGTLAAGASQGIWLRRVVVANAASYDGNQATLRVEGETS